MRQFKILNAQDHLILLGTGSLEDELTGLGMRAGITWPAPTTAFYVKGNLKGFFFDEDTQSWKPGWGNGFGNNLDQETFKFSPRIYFKTSDFEEENSVGRGLVQRDDGAFVMVFPKNKEVLESWGELYRTIQNQIVPEEHKNPNPPVKTSTFNLPTIKLGGIISSSEIPPVVPNQISSNTATFFDKALDNPRSDNHEVLFDSNPCSNHNKRIVDTFEETGVIEDDEIIFE